MYLTLVISFYCPINEEGVEASVIDLKLEMLKYLLLNVLKDFQMSPQVDLDYNRGKQSPVLLYIY